MNANTTSRTVHSVDQGSSERRKADWGSEGERGSRRQENLALKLRLFNNAFVRRFSARSPVS